MRSPSPPQNPTQCTNYPSTRPQTLNGAISQSPRLLPQTGCLHPSQSSNLLPSHFTHHMRSLPGSPWPHCQEYAPNEHMLWLGLVGLARARSFGCSVSLSVNRVWYFTKCPQLKHTTHHFQGDDQSRHCTHSPQICQQIVNEHICPSNAMLESNAWAGVSRLTLGTADVSQ